MCLSGHENDMKRYVTGPASSDWAYAANRLYSKSCTPDDMKRYVTDTPSGDRACAYAIL